MRAKYAIPQDLALRRMIQPWARLLDIPTWNQLVDPLPDGTPDPASETDCGEECAAMAIYAATGVAFSAGAIRDAMMLPETTGVSTAGQLSSLLNRLRLPSAIKSEGWGDALAHMRAGFAREQVGIALGFWDSAQVLHWILAIAPKDEGMWANDPWGGRRIHVTREAMHTSYAGVWVSVDVSRNEQ